jgi:hypothetical protein
MGLALAGQRIKASHRGALTSCREQCEGVSGQNSEIKLTREGAPPNCQAQSDGVIRTAKESQWAKGIHKLSIAEQGRQDNEIRPASERHSLSAECREGE